MLHRLGRVNDAITTAVCKGVRDVCVDVSASSQWWLPGKSRAVYTNKRGALVWGRAGLSRLGRPHVQLHSNGRVSNGVLSRGRVTGE